MVILILLPICLLACIILLPMCQKISDEDWARTQSASNLHLLYLAMETYHDVYGRLPPPVILGKNGEPLLSWRIAILPFVEGDESYRQFHLHEPWDSPHNRALIEKMPRVYSDMLGLQPGITHYQIVVGPGTPFEKEGLTWNDIANGRSNTILIVDALNGVPWTKPDDVHYDPTRPIGAIGSFHQKSIYFSSCRIGSRQVFNAVFADGSVHSFRKDKDPETIRGFITGNGGEPLDWSLVE